MARDLRAIARPDVLLGQNGVQQAALHRPVARRLEADVTAEREAAVHVQREGEGRAADRAPILAVDKDDVEHGVINLDALQHARRRRPDPDGAQGLPLATTETAHDAGRAGAGDMAVDGPQARRRQMIRGRAALIGIGDAREHEEVHVAAGTVARGRRAGGQHSAHDGLHLRRQPAEAPRAGAIGRRHEGADIVAALDERAQPPLQAPATDRGAVVAARGGGISGEGGPRPRRRGQRQQRLDEGIPAPGFVALGRRDAVQIGAREWLGSPLQIVGAGAQSRPLEHERAHGPRRDKVVDGRHLLAAGGQVLDDDAGVGERIAHEEDGAVAPVAGPKCET